MTIEELVGRFYHKLNGPDDATAEDAMREVVRALRDEIVHEFRLSGKFHADNLYQLFSEILASDGVEAAR